MRKIIATFVIEENISENTWKTIGTVVSTLDVEKFPVKYSEIKSFAEKDLPNYQRLKCLQSICDVTDLVDFDE